MTLLFGEFALPEEEWRRVSCEAGNGMEEQMWVLGAAEAVMITRSM